MSGLRVNNHRTTVEGLFFCFIVSRQHVKLLLHTRANARMNVENSLCFMYWNGGGMKVWTRMLAVSVSLTYLVEFFCVKFLHDL